MQFYFVEELALSSQIEQKKDWEKDYEKMIKPLIEPNTPCYILFRFLAGILGLALND